MIIFDLKVDRAQLCSTTWAGDTKPAGYIEHRTVSRAEDVFLVAIQESVRRPV